MNAPLPRNCASPSALLTREPGDLALLLDTACTVAILQRELPAAIAAYLDAAARAGALGTGFRTVLAPGERAFEASLPALPGREALAADVALLATLYADLLGCPRLGLRMEVTRAPMCPRFHRDRVGIRLLCTYRGAGTAWIDPAAPDPAAAIARGDVRHANPGNVVLLKGDAWPGNENGGALHRSPEVAPREAPRVLAAIDAIW